ncbi:Lysosomal Pro-X carboxypeptidase [Linum perenne]
MYDSNYDTSTVQTLTAVEDLETYFYNQTLDHFNYRPESYVTFRQRYVINSKHWGGPGAPIFVLLGAEAPLRFNSTAPNGFVVDFSSRFNSLLVYIEHRYYGESIPFNSRSTLGYFNSQQAIADYAEIILHVKEQFNAGDSPVIVFGGSYGGMLATWFRLKYPHIAIGALASSAPILYFDDITPQDGYYNVVTKDFKDASETCYQTIRKSWVELDELASKPDGLLNLSQKFKTCLPLKDVSLLKDSIGDMYARAAQYNTPPTYPVDKICKAIDGASENDTLGKIFAAIVAYQGIKKCYINEPVEPSETNVGWGWQECSEMVMPIGYGNLSTLFYSTDAFNLTEFTDTCISLYGVPPRPHWVTTYYGGHSIKRILKRFGSNIIFSNGLKDPYSSGGYPNIGSM